MLADGWMRPVSRVPRAQAGASHAVRVSLAPLVVVASATPIGPVPWYVLAPAITSALPDSVHAVLDLPPALAPLALADAVALDPAPVAQADPQPVPALEAPTRFDNASTYHALADLSARPMLLTPVELLLGPGESRAIQPGRLRIRLLISALGRVDEVVIDEGTLAPRVRDAVIARFAAALYQPGEIDGQPVRSQITIEVSS